MQLRCESYICITHAWSPSKRKTVKQVKSSIYLINDFSGTVNQLQRKKAYYVD